MVLAIVCTAFGALVPAASAGSQTYNATITSDSGGYWGFAHTPYRPQGTISIRQDRSDPGTPGNYRLVNQANGASTSVKQSYGAMVSWTGVVAGQFTLQVQTAWPRDTNGWLPGAGNTGFWGTFYY